MKRPQRRQDYAKEISEKVKQLDSTKFNFKYEHLSETNHNNIVARGLSLALDFIYQPYSSYPELDSTATVLSAIENFEKEISKLYGIFPEKNSFNYYNYFLFLAWQRNDTTGMLDAINYFLTDKSTGRNIRDFAYFSSALGLTKKAKLLYEQAIKKF